jgi:hypothetical protein
MFRLHSRSCSRRRLGLGVATAAVLLAIAAEAAQAAPFVYVTNAGGDVSQFDTGAGGLLAPLSPPTVAAAEVSRANAKGHTKVVCLDENTFKHEYKFRPHHCIFHKRHSPNAEAFFVRTSHDRWKHWRNSRARGVGKSQGSMGPPTQVRIRLYRARPRCGHRVFTRARFYYPSFNHGATLRLSSCAQG